MRFHYSSVHRITAEYAEKKSSQEYVYIELRVHPSKKSLRGFYVAPNLAYNRLKSNEEGESFTAFSLGALVGWQSCGEAEVLIRKSSLCQIK